jgi:hypothetical protein
MSAASLSRDPTIEPESKTMVDKHELKSLSDAVSEAWKNVNFAKVNGLDVRLRVVTDRTANFHAHEDSDERHCQLNGLEVSFRSPLG